MIRLRPYKNCDAEYIVKWIKDEVAFRKWCANCFESYPLSAQMLNAYYMERMDSDSFWVMTALDDTQVVGQVMMRFLDDEKKILRFGFVIVDDSRRGKGYGKQMLSLALKYAFEILKVEKVTLGVFENNASAYHCYQSLGFKESGDKGYSEILGDKWCCIELEHNGSKE